MRCSVVFGVTLRFLVINISSSSPAINTAAYYQRCVIGPNLRHAGRAPPATALTTPACCSVNTGSQARYSNGLLYSNTVIGTLAVDEWAVTFGTARRGLLAVPNETVHPSTASVPTSHYSIWHHYCHCPLKS